MFWKPVPLPVISTRCPYSLILPSVPGIVVGGRDLRKDRPPPHAAQSRHALLLCRQTSMHQNRPPNGYPKHFPARHLEEKATLKPKKYIVASNMGSPKQNEEIGGPQSFTPRSHMHCSSVPYTGNNTKHCPRRMAKYPSGTALLYNHEIIR